MFSLLNCYLSFLPFPIKVPNLIHMLFPLFSSDKMHQDLFTLTTEGSSLNIGFLSCSTFFVCVRTLFHFLLLLVLSDVNLGLSHCINLFLQSGSLLDFYFFLVIKEFYQNIHSGMCILSPLPPGWMGDSCFDLQFPVFLH